MIEPSQKFNLANQPIGVMDSGVGGISVLKHIHALLPHEPLLYFADSQHAPYGNKTAVEITQRCFEIADFLIGKGVKALVVACNTATAAAIDALRDQYSGPGFNIPIIGMEPAVKPAAEATRNGIIGVLATVGTLKSAQFAALLESYGRNVEVITQGCIGLVECIERGELNSEETHTLVRQYCAPLLAHGADTIVLGCTHYPFVRPVIEQQVGANVVIIDTGAAVAKQLQKRLLKRDLLTQPLYAHQKGEVSFWTNSKAPTALQVIHELWGATAQISLL
ncbi:MAG: glutamate racemase [Methylotenera sp.]|nr:glutamate racemase [Methylotenera sp.]